MFGPKCARRADGPGRTVVDQHGVLHFRGQRDFGRCALGRARADGDPHRVLGNIQRARNNTRDRAEVVPLPPQARSRLVECIIVADDPAFDSRDTSLAQGRDEHGGEVVAARPQRAWIAATRDHEIASEAAAVDSAMCIDSRFECVVPSHGGGGHGCGDELESGARHEKRTGVPLEEPLSRAE